MTAAIAIVFFDSDNPGLTGEGVAHMLSSQFPDVTVGNIQSEENTISFNVDPDVAVVLGHMPGPVPWDSLAGPASVSLLWPESEQPLNAHKSHMIVTIAGEIDNAFTLGLPPADGDPYTFENIAGWSGPAGGRSISVLGGNGVDVELEIVTSDGICQPTELDWSSAD